MHDTQVSTLSGTNGGTGFPHLWVPVPLNDGAWAIVSPEDAPAVLARKWHTWAAPQRPNALYARNSTKVCGKVVTTWLHRFVLGVADPKVYVDHEDGDGLNCLRYNLRTASALGNSRNVVHSHNRKRGGFKGVNWNKRAGKWEAAIAAGERKPDGKRKKMYLGVFVDPEDAARAYDAAALEHFGAFAALNFPALRLTG